MPSNVLGSLRIELTANAAAFISDLGKAAHAVQSNAQQMSREFSSVQRVASQTFSAFGALAPQISQYTYALSSMASAASSAMKAFGPLKNGIGAIMSVAAGAAVGFGAVEISMAGLALKAIKAAAEMEHLAQKSGVTVEEMSGLSFAAKQVNISQEQLGLGLARLSKNAEMAAQGSSQQAAAFKSLHVSALDAHGALRPIQDILLEIAGRFAQAKDGTAKTAIAMQAFGKAGFEMIPFLNLGKEGIAAFIKQAEELGIVLDSRTARGAVQLEQQMNVLQARFQSFEIGLARDLLPTLEVLISSLSAVGRSVNATAGDTEKLKGASPTSGWAHGLQETAYLFSAIAIAIDQTASQIQQLIDLGAGVVTVGLWDRPLKDFAKKRDNITSETKWLADLKAGFSQSNELEAKRPQMKADILQFAGGGAIKATAQDLQDLSRYLDGLSGQQLKKIGQDAMAAHKNVAEFAMGLAKLSAGGPNLDTPAGEAQKQLASALEAVIKKYVEARATAGLFAFQIEDYKLKILGATPAVIAHVDALRELAASNKLAAKEFNASVLIDVAERGKQAGAAAEGLAAAIEDAARAGASLRSLPEMLKGIASSLDEDIAGKVKGIADSLREQIANFGKSPTEIEMMKLGPGVTEGQRAQIEDLTHELALAEAAEKGLRVGGGGKGNRDYSKEIAQLKLYKKAIQDHDPEESTLLVDARLLDTQQQLNEQWDQAAMKVGTLKERLTALFDEIQQQGQNLGDKIFGSMTRSIDDISTQLAQLVVTGKSNFGQLAKSFEESIAKAVIQKGIAVLTADLGKKLNIPGLPGAKRDGSSSGNALYVIPVSSSGGILVPGLGTGLPTNLGSSLDIPPVAPGGGPSGGIISFIAKLFGGSSSSTSAIKTPPFFPFNLANTSQAGAPPNDLGSSLDIPPAEPSGGSGSSILSFIAKVVGASGSTAGSTASGNNSSAALSAAASALSSSGTALRSSSSALSSAASALKSAASALKSAASSLRSSGGKGGGGVFSGSGGGDSGDSGSGGGDWAQTISDIMQVAMMGMGMADGGDVTPGKAYIVGEKRPEIFIPKIAGRILPSTSSFTSSIAAMGSKFGGYRAAGGDVSPGKAYVVGENRPEIFLPEIAGRILPSTSSFTSSIAAMGSKFGGYRAAGGDVSPGSAYLTGERRPELFVPRMPASASADGPTQGNTKNINLGGFHVHGVSDADSFRRSQGQILAQLHAQLNLANERK